jgi:competence protein ComEC
MKRIFLLVALGGMGSASPGSVLGQDTRTDNLEIYWIDVEGGKATLFVSPTGESLLYDTGFPEEDRDAKRIYALTQEAGLSHIDHVVISHWHRDHVGGVTALSEMIPIGRFYDHGESVEPADQERRDAYKAVAGGRRTSVRAGDTIPFDGVQLRVVVSEGPVIAQAINDGGPNSLCANAVHMGPAGPENQRTIGLSLNYGDFKFVSLGDLDWQREMELACPINKLGTVTLFTVSRHGSLDNSGAPALLGAIRPQVVVVDNGPRKGLGARDDRVETIAVPGVQPAPYERNAYLRLTGTPGVEDVWQVHLSLLDSDPDHNTSPDMIANLEEGARDQAHWLHAAVSPDGSFTMTNSRTGFSKTYKARR